MHGNGLVNCTYLFTQVIFLLLQVLNALREVSFNTETGEKVFFDENGDPAARYDLLNWQQGEDGTTEFVKVGFYDASLIPGFQLSFNNISIVWAKNQHQVIFVSWSIDLKYTLHCCKQDASFVVVQIVMFYRFLYLCAVRAVPWALGRL